VLILGRGVRVGVRVRVRVTLNPWLVQAVRRYMEKGKRARGAAAKTEESESSNPFRPVLTFGRGLGLGLESLTLTPWFV